MCANYNRLNEIYKVSERDIKEVFYNYDSKDFCNNLYGLSKWLNTSINTVEYLRLSIIEEDTPNIPLHEILDFFCKELLDFCSVSEHHFALVKNSNAVEFISHILTKDIEYYRRSKDFETPQNHINLGLRLSADNSFLLNQQAKLNLCYFQHHYLTTGEKLENLYNIGFSQLKENAKKIFLSANLLGIIYFNPAPYLVECGVVKNMDYKSALCIYLNIIFNSSFTGREISYTATAALKLLINGYVSVNENVSSYKITRVQPQDLSCDCSPKFLNSNTLLLSEKILSKVIGQDEALLNYMRGSIALFKKNFVSANGYFQSPLPKEIKRPGLYAYYHIRQYLDKNIDTGTVTLDIIKEEITTVYNSVTNNKGVIDDTNPLYFYLELKRLILSYNDKTIYDFINELEQTNTTAKRLCDTIESLPQQQLA